MFSKTRDTLKTTTPIVATAISLAKCESGKEAQMCKTRANRDVEKNVSFIENDTSAVDTFVVGDNGAFDFVAPYPSINPPAVASASAVEVVEIVEIAAALVPLEAKAAQIKRVRVARKKAPRTSPQATHIDADLQAAIALIISLSLERRLTVPKLKLKPLPVHHNNSTAAKQQYTCDFCIFADIRKPRKRSIAIKQ